MDLGYKKLKNRKTDHTTTSGIEGLRDNPNNGYEGDEFAVVTSLWRAQITTPLEIPIRLQIFL